jgi:hypothetical protein
MTVFKARKNTVNGIPLLRFLRPLRDAKCFYFSHPATPWLANLLLSLRDWAKPESKLPRSLDH